MSLVHLRILATSDLHANLMPFDYYTDRRDDRVGLLRLGGLITAERAACGNVLLFDNGDTLQGTPLGDVAAAACRSDGVQHPMVAAMNALRFDAATLGNHDFDFGLETLSRALAAADFPIVSANAGLRDGSDWSVLPGVLLQRDMTDASGRSVTIRVGVTGTLPPQVTQWNRETLQGRLSVGCAVRAAASEASRLRALGADLVVVLAHSGLGVDAPAGSAENVAKAIARLPQVDAVVAGHTHEVFPPTAECRSGLPQTPIVQPGSAGSHLGRIDVALVRRSADGADTPWKVHRTHAETVSVPEAATRIRSPLRQTFRQSRALLRTSVAQHRATRRVTARPLGATGVRLHTYFSLLAPCAATQLVADATRAAARDRIAELGMTDHARLPLLVAVSPMRVGGPNATENYTDIPPGPLLLRHAADLYCYPNFLTILRMRGRDVRLWLERAAAAFHRIDPSDTSPQPLIDHDFAGYNFDRLDGLSYDIDVSRPARTNARGDVTGEKGQRILNLRRTDGRPVRDDDAFLVVTNSYRAAGGGGFDMCEASERIFAGQHPVRDILAASIVSAGTPVAPVPRATFRLTGTGRATLVLETGPGARAVVEEGGCDGLIPEGLAPSGLARFLLKKSAVPQIFAQV